LNTGKSEGQQNIKHLTVVLPNVIWQQVALCNMINFNNRESQSGNNRMDRSHFCGKTEWPSYTK